MEAESARPAGYDLGSWESDRGLLRAGRVVGARGAGRKVEGLCWWGRWVGERGWGGGGEGVAVSWLVRRRRGKVGFMALGGDGERCVQKGGMEDRIL